MAFLMLLHEKMRLQRKQNKLTLKQLRNGNQLSRMESKIKRREKYYSKLEKQLETQANAMKNSMKMAISNQMGLGMNSVNLNNPYGSSAAAMNIAASLFSSQLSEPDYNTLMAVMGGAYVQGYNADGTRNGKYTLDPSYTGAQGLPSELTAEAIAKFQRYQSQANQAVSQQQAMCQSYQANYENQVSIWLDYAKQDLESKQEWEMDLLAEEQQDYESEKESIAAELELVKQRKEAIEQELGQSIKDSAPKFGLA